MKLFQILAAAVCAAGLGMAQQSIHYASLGGRVADPSGAVIAAARVTAIQVGTHVTATTESGPDGRFRFAYLRPGTLEIRVEKPNFAAAVQTLELAAGGAYELPLTLQLESAQTGVTVTAESAVLDTARSQVAGTVPRTEIVQLPLNGRNFLDIALLIPGVAPTNTASTQLFPETSAVPGQGISINSQRNFSNSFIVDGLAANDDAAGLSGLPYGVDAIEQLQVVTSGGQAEFGRALGGYLSLVTRSGTADLHGDLYGYFRNQRFNAANPLSGRKLPLTQAQYGASLGGPLRRERTFAFTNFEQRRLQQSGLVTIAPENVAVINARLAAVGYAGPQVSTGMYPNPVHSTHLLGKVDHQAGGRDQMYLRYTLYHVNSRNSRGAGALNAPSAAAGLNNTDHNFAAGNILTLSPRVVNETRAQFTSSHLTAEPADPLGPAFSIAGVATAGRLSGSPTGRTNRLYEVADNFSVVSGAHSLRAGVDLLYNGTEITYPRSIRGSYSFSSLANFLAGVYNNSGFAQTFGPSRVGVGNPNAGFYVQDEWKMTPNLTWNLGLRYDLQFLETLRTDRNNVSPRIGLAWTPFPSRRSVIRANWGLFYDRVPLRALANALLSSRNTTTLTPGSQVVVSLSPTQAGAPVFPNVISSMPAGVLVNFTTMDRDLQNAYSVQTGVEWEQQLSSRSTFRMGYQDLRGLHLLLSVNQNVPACAATGTNNGCRPNPAYANNSRYSSLGNSRYRALNVSFEQKPVGWGFYRISYTLSAADDNLGEFFFSAPLDNYNIWQDWGRSDDDRRHRVVVHGEWYLPAGIRLGGTLEYASALPLNITTGSNTVQGTAARPLVNGQPIQRNAGTGFHLLQANLRLSRVFGLREHGRMEAILQGFNALNRVNGATRNGVFGTGSYPDRPLSTYRQTTAVLDPRSLEFALRFSF